MQANDNTVKQAAPTETEVSPIFAGLFAPVAVPALTEEQQLRRCVNELLLYISDLRSDAVEWDGLDRKTLVDWCDTTTENAMDEYGEVIG